MGGGAGGGRGAWGLTGALGNMAIIIKGYMACNMGCSMGFNTIWVLQLTCTTLQLINIRDSHVEIVMMRYHSGCSAGWQGGGTPSTPSLRH